MSKLLFQLHWKAKGYTWSILWSHANIQSSSFIHHFKVVHSVMALVHVNQFSLTLGLYEGESESWLW